MTAEANQTPSPVMPPPPLRSVPAIETKPAQAPARGPTPAARSEAPSQAAAAERDEPGAEQLWTRARAATTASASIRAAMDELECVGERPGIVVVRGKSPDALAAAKARKASIEEFLSKAAGRTVRVEFQSSGDAPPTSPRAGANVDAHAIAAAQSHPLVRRAMEILDARLIDVQDEPQ